MKTETCTEWDDKEDLVCGEIAPYELKIVFNGDKHHTFKCHKHIKRYYKGIPLAKTTITAVGSKKNANT